MGCDIHAHLDINGDHFASIDIPRDYTLFHALAGVRRGEVEQVFQLRGLPNDEILSWQTKKDLDEWEGDAHSVSWLNAAELAEISKRYAEKLGLKHPELEAIIAAMNVLEQDEPGKVILTFWFDN